MTRFYTTFLIATFFKFLSVQALAQECEGGRYLQPLFGVMEEPDVNYGSAITVENQEIDLFMDFYMPEGDAQTERPAIIVAHGGGFVSGTRDGADVVPFCQDMAARGYVVASIQYRLGISDAGAFLPTSNSATRAVWRATHDARAAVRFLRKTAAEDDNPYGIDPERIYFAGASAGGFIGLHLAYLDTPEELPMGIDPNSPGITEDIEGESGNPGFSSEIGAVVNVAGAIGDTAWMQPNDVPVLSFHGTNDDVVPYGSATLTLLGILPVLEVDGSESVHARAEELGLYHCLEEQEAQGHVPHVTSPAHYDTLLNMNSRFLADLVCETSSFVCAYETILSADRVNSTLQAEVWPNPTQGNLSIQLPDNAGGVVSYRLVTVTGAEVERGTFAGNRAELNLSLPAGVYMLHLDTSNGLRALQRVVVKQ